MNFNLDPDGLDGVLGPAPASVEAWETAVAMLGIRERVRQHQVYTRLDPNGLDGVLAAPQALPKKAPSEDWAAPTLPSVADSVISPFPSVLQTTVRPMEEPEESTDQVQRPSSPFDEMTQPQHFAQPTLPSITDSVIMALPNVMQTVLNTFRKPEDKRPPPPKRTGWTAYIPAAVYLVLVAVVIFFGWRQFGSSDKPLPSPPLATKAPTPPKNAKVRPIPGSTAKKPTAALAPTPAKPTAAVPTPQPTAVVPARKRRPEPPKGAYVLASRYGINSVALRVTEKEMVDLATRYRRCQEVVITGHTCDQGSEKTNWKIGLGRAESVRRALVSNGLPNDRISIVSSGSRAPIATNKTEAGRTKNRRVTLECKGLLPL